MKRLFKVSLYTIITFVAILSLSKCKVDEGDIYGSFPYLNVPFSDTTITKVAQTVTIPVQTNRTINATITDAVWLEASASGQEIILHVKENPLEETRMATLEVKTANATATYRITITQHASGELTIEGDLILRNADEINNNTYTKTTKSLIIGNITSNTPAAASRGIAPAGANGDINVKFGNKIYTVAPASISNSEMDVLSDRIHLIGDRAVLIANTNVSKFPYILVQANGVKRLYMVSCELGGLPSADSLNTLNLTELNLADNNLATIGSLTGLDSLIYLNLSDNKIVDITGLGENENLTELYLDNNPIANIDELAKLPQLKKLSLKGLPILGTQYEILMEKLPEGCVVDTTSIRPEESELVNIGTPTGQTSSENSFVITAKAFRNNSNITKAGFYVGTTNSLEQMEFVSGTYNPADSTITATVEGADMENCVYFFRGYAENGTGASYSPLNRFGDRLQDGDYFIRNEDELKAFYDAIITKIEGSLFIGNTVEYTGDNTITVSTEDTTLHFDPSSIKSLSGLGNLSSISEGLYVVNTMVDNMNFATRFEGITTLNLGYNEIAQIPDISGMRELRSLTLAGNNISDFTPLLRLNSLDSLYLGNSQKPYLESNNIGVILGLEELSNLKYLDLGGLPLHQWQVDELKVAMPECNIVFVPGNRNPFLPVLTSETATIGEGTVTIRGTLTNKGEGQITEYGFYWGTDKDNLQRVTVGTSDLGSGTTFERQLTITDEQRYYYQPFAVNTYGEANSRDYREFTLSYINLSERGTSNCYIVSNAGRYTFNPHIIGNGSAGIIDTANFHTTSVEIESISAASRLWETTDGMITDVTYRPDTRDVLFTSNGTEGNALIAVKDATGTILWSWHIWVTDQPVEHQYINHQGQKFGVLDRNLGATRANRGTGDEWEDSRGLAYQWGRKDPFAWYHNEEYYDGQFSLIDAIQNPTKVPVSYEKWLNEENWNLWHPSIKTIYDPCPMGYKVAVKDVYTGFTTTGNPEWALDYMNIKSPFDNGFYFYYDGVNTAWYPTTVSHSGYYSSDGYMWLCNSEQSYSGAKRFVFGTSWVDWNAYTSWTKESHSVRCMYDAGYQDAYWPALETVSVDDVTSHTANASGNVTSEGNGTITERGFVWANFENVTIANGIKVTVPTEGSFLGEYNVSLENLTPGTTLYIRAYATNEHGTGYGKAIQIRTKDGGSSEDVERDEDFEW